MVGTSAGHFFTCGGHCFLHMVAIVFIHVGGRHHMYLKPPGNASTAPQGGLFFFAQFWFPWGMGPAGSHFAGHPKDTESGPPPRG